MAARVFETLSAFRDSVGEELGTSKWHEITQDQVDLFADATGDHQWIHVDPEKAKTGPFGGTIAHGYLTLSLLPVMSSEIYDVADRVMGLNYGANKIRFPNPVPVGSRVRATATLTAIADIPIGTQATITFVVEIDGVTKPALIAEVIYVMASAPAAS